MIQSLEQQLQNAVQELEMCREQLQAGSLTSKKVIMESQNADLAASQTTELELWSRVEALETEVAQKDCALSQLTEELQIRETDKAKMAEAMQSKMKEAEGRLGTSLFNEESNSVFNVSFMPTASHSHFWILSCS